MNFERQFESVQEEAVKTSFKVLPQNFTWGAVGKHDASTSGYPLFEPRSQT
jgi:hypothetical protein